MNITKPIIKVLIIRFLKIAENKLNELSQIKEKLNFIVIGDYKSRVKNQKAIKK